MQVTTNAVRVVAENLSGVIGAMIALTETPRAEAVKDGMRLTTCPEPQSKRLKLR